MFGLIKKVFTGLLSFSGSLAVVSNSTICTSLNNHTWMTRPTLIGLNPVE